MERRTHYEIEIRGRASDRVLRPALDDFRITRTEQGTTRLVGEIRDPAHLHGLLAHFASLNVELVAVQAVDDPEKGTTS
ncbi:MAG: hypothetical protein AAGA17_13480 [Actinomycetota bacterium]